MIPRLEGDAVLRPDVFVGDEAKIRDIAMAIQQNGCVLWPRGFVQDFETTDMI